MYQTNRRTFLGVLGAGALAGWRAFAQETAAELRTISYNVLAFRGYPTGSESRARLDSEAASLPERTAEALATFAPDVVTLQEAPSAEVSARFAKALGFNHVWLDGGWEGDDRYPGGFPGVIATRYAIVEHENRPSAGAPHDAELFSRHLGRALLETPSGKLHVVSAHFHASDHPVRMREAAAIVALIDQLRTSAPVLLQGDLNHQPGDPEYQVWLDAGLVDTAAKMGAGSQMTANSIRPRARIDYVWATPDLAERATAARVLDGPPFQPDGDDETSYALSDHLPVMAAFRA